MLLMLRTLRPDLSRLEERRPWAVLGASDLLPPPKGPCHRRLRVPLLSLRGVGGGVSLVEFPAVRPRAPFRGERGLCEGPRA